MTGEQSCVCGHTRDEHVDRVFGCTMTVPFGEDGEVFCHCSRFTVRAQEADR